MHTFSLKARTFLVSSISIWPDSSSFCFLLLLFLLLFYCKASALVEATKKRHAFFLLCSCFGFYSNVPHFDYLLTGDGDFIVGRVPSGFTLLSSYILFPSWSPILFCFSFSQVSEAMRDSLFFFLFLFPLARA